MHAAHFIALELPEPIRDQLIAVAGGVPGAYWEEEEQLHLTLRYLGEIDGGTRSALFHQLERLHPAPFELILTGFGFFPPRGEPESLWVGVERSASLEALRARVDATATRLGVPTDRRRWTPHVTLARLEGAPESRLVRFAQENALFRSAPFVPTRMTAFSSHRRDWGFEYRREAIFPLRPA
jgi:2'-5' RNA ligase